MLLSLSARLQCGQFCIIVLDHNPCPVLSGHKRDIISKYVNAAHRKQKFRGNRWSNYLAKSICSPAWLTCEWHHILNPSDHYDSGPPFAAITALTFLERVSMGIFDHSFTSAFASSHTVVGQGGLALGLSASALIHPKGVLSGWDEDSVQAIQVNAR